MSHDDVYHDDVYHDDVYHDDVSPPDDPNVKKFVDMLMSADSNNSVETESDTEVEAIQGSENSQTKTPRGEGKPLGDHQQPIVHSTNRIGGRSARIKRHPCPCLQKTASSTTKPPPQKSEFEIPPAMLRQWKRRDMASAKQ